MSSFEFDQQFEEYADSYEKLIGSPRPKTGSIGSLTSSNNLNFNFGNDFVMLARDTATAEEDMGTPATSFFDLTMFFLCAVSVSAPFTAVLSSLTYFSVTVFQDPRGFICHPYCCKYH